MKHLVESANELCPFCPLTQLNHCGCLGQVLQVLRVSVKQLGAQAAAPQVQIQLSAVGLVATVTGPVVSTSTSASIAMAPPVRP